MESFHKKSASSSTLPKIPQATQSLTSSPTNSSLSKPRRHLSIASFKTQRPIPVYGPPSSNKMGPGHYIVAPLSQGPSFEFSLNPRFEYSYHDKIKIIMSRQHLFISKSRQDISFPRKLKILPHRRQLRSKTTTESLSPLSPLGKKD